MPFHVYECSAGHRTERFFKTISEGELYDMIICDACGDESLPGGGKKYVLAKKVPSAPLGFGLYGSPEGYDKPSPTKRYSTKLVSRKEGNASSAG
jgi:hypothetical protein